ncbi:MAG: ABC transporter permease, partial [Cytophagia bacterium]|nr:ABC transporter permease [Cytophagia bacterium]
MTEDFYDIDPPKRAERFFEWYCNPRLRETIGGDLYERYIDNYEQHGLKKANRKYWIDVIRFMNRHTLKRSKQSKFNNMSMLSNYFKVGFRNLVRNKSFTAINVLGLSVSMAVCLIIILMINDQLSYDRF